MKEAKEARLKRIEDFVSRYSQAMQNIPAAEREKQGYEHVIPCGILRLKNDRELAAALEEISLLGLPDPIPWAHKKVNAYEFLKFCQEKGIDHTRFASSAAALSGYITRKSLFWKITWLCGLRYNYHKKSSGWYRDIGP